jgi:protocatechuate 3,4-dioxygenase beta subunit
MNPRSVLCRALFLGSLASQSMSGQGVASVRGTVTNEAGRPIEHAQVTLDPQGANRQLRTDREGRFNFIGVPQGSHTLRVTWVGFTPEAKQFDMTGGDVVVDVVLRRLTYLDTVAVTAKRTGLYGSVISKDSLLPVPNARIEIIGARKADSTNSSGTFNFPGLKPGSYIVRVKHPFFESRNFGVTVPGVGGTELDVVVDRGRVSRDQHLEMFYREMDTRLSFRGVDTAFVTREQLKGKEKMTLSAAVESAPEFARRALLIMSDVCVFVDGIARPGTTLRDFAVEDVEAVEFYGATWRTIIENSQRAIERMDPTGSLRDRWPPRVPCGQPLSPGEAEASKTNVKVMFAHVWLRK